MPALVELFFSHVLPWLVIALMGGAWTTFRKVDKLQNDLAILTRDCHQLTLMVDAKWKDVDERVKEDIRDLKSQIDYISRNNVTRDELERYLKHLNDTINRLSDTLKELL